MAPSPSTIFEVPNSTCFDSTSENFPETIRNNTSFVSFKVFAFHPDSIRRLPLSTMTVHLVIPSRCD